MRFKSSLILACLPIMLLAACDSSPPAADTTVPESAATEIAETPILASDLKIAERSPTLTYNWRVPPEVAEHPALYTELHDQALSAQTKMREMAREQAQFRAENELPPRPIAAETKWRTAWEGEALLNLTADVYSFTGGAHPNTGFLGLLWDKRTESEVSLTDLFTDWPTARTAIEERFCTALDEERLARRGARSEGQGAFGECPNFAEQPVQVIGQPYASFTGLRFLISPYVAGPYAEGSYEIDVSLDGALQDAIKPDYLPAR